MGKMHDIFYREIFLQASHLIFVIVHVDRVITANFKQIKHSFNVIEKMMEYGIHCLSCFYTSDVM